MSQQHLPPQLQPSRLGLETYLCFSVTPLVDDSDGANHQLDAARQLGCLICAALPSAIGARV
jgi:hypothetical protein